MTEQKKKGISPLIAAAVLLVISVALATLVSSFLSTFSFETSMQIKNNTKSQLSCQFGDMEIKNATYNCANNCSAGKAHNLTITLFNSGKIGLEVRSVFIQNTTGNTFELGINATFLDPAVMKTFTNSSADSCSGINNTIEKITATSATCPNAFDSLPGDEVVFVNC